MKNKWEFLSSIDEWHSFVIGVCEIICPWKPRIPRVIPVSISMTAKPQNIDKDYLQNEYHYYLFGRAVGVLSWIGIASLIKWLFF